MQVARPLPIGKFFNWNLPVDGIGEITLKPETFAGATAIR
jgi:hypothetical protein